jgi:hypothetical protein
VALIRLYCNVINYYVIIFHVIIFNIIYYSRYIINKNRIVWSYYPSVLLTSISHYAKLLSTKTSPLHCPKENNLLKIYLLIILFYQILLITSVNNIIYHDHKFPLNYVHYSCEHLMMITGTPGHNYCGHDHKLCHNSKLGEN